jgi:hypothetical protein
MGYMEKYRRNEWFDEECKQEMNKKNEAYNNYLKRPTRAKRIIYEVARRKTNKICRQKKRSEINKTLLETEEKFQGRHISRAYKEIKTRLKYDTGSSIRDGAAIKRNSGVCCNNIQMNTMYLDASNRAMNFDSRRVRNRNIC